MCDNWGLTQKCDGLGIHYREKNLNSNSVCGLLNDESHILNRPSSSSSLLFALPPAAAAAAAAAVDDLLHAAACCVLCRWH